MTLHRANLPESVTYNKKKYVVNMDLSAQYSMGKAFQKCQHVKVHVLSKNLKGKTDFHGNKYQPSKWIFTPLN